MTATELIEALGLARHREGGWYRETWRASDPKGERPSATMIYFLLQAGEVSRWHRVDATEIWCFHAGAPLDLSLAPEEGPAETRRLGPGARGGERPQIVVPAGWWQSAVSTGDWTLVGCAVSPGFVFEGFELAPEGWAPGARP